MVQVVVCNGAFAYVIPCEGKAICKLVKYIKCYIRSICKFSSVRDVRNGFILFVCVFFYVRFMCFLI